MKRPTYPRTEDTNGPLVGGSVPDHCRNEEILARVRGQIQFETTQLRHDDTETWNLLGRIWAVMNGDPAA